jgi:hypothetical protein
MNKDEVADNRVLTAQQAAAVPAYVQVPDMEEFHYDILVAYVHHIRVLAWMAGEQQIGNIWKTLRRGPDRMPDIFSPDSTVRDLGLTWEDVAHTDFAAYLETMYRFAYQGLVDVDWEPMEQDTGYTWVSAILMDMERSWFLEEWSGGYSGEGAGSIDRCRAVAELANARMTLESGKPFCLFLQGRGRENDIDEDSLSVRQMALLAGMEEMSIRAAANPKRRNVLRTYSDNGKTRIALEVAREWLESKGRYVRTRYYSSGRNIALGNTTFRNLNDLFLLVERRLSHVRILGAGGQVHAGGDVVDYLEARAEMAGEGQTFDLEQERAMLSSPDFLRSAAEVLELPVDLFTLRVRELLATEELEAVRRRLKELSHAN